MQKKIEDVVYKSHFSKAPEMVLRTKTDEIVSESFLKSRGNTFELLNELYPDQLEQPSLVSSCYGKITNLLLTIPDWVFGYDPYLKVYKDLIFKLPEHTKFLIYINSKSKASLAQLIEELDVKGRVEIIETTQHGSFTVWAEDAYVVCTDLQNSEVYFVEPASFKRGEDNMIADNIAAASDYKTTLKKLYFQGGNILIEEDKWLIGFDYPNNSLDEGYIVPDVGETKLEAIKRGYKKLDQEKTLIPIGSTLNVPADKHVADLDIGNGKILPLFAFYGNKAGTVQPIFHIDMFITLAGKDENGSSIVLVADPSMTRDLLPNEELVQYLDQFTMTNIFNDYAVKLEQQGFSVIRNPVSLCIQHEQARGNNPEYLYAYFATSNNALVEVTETEKKVWLPTYGYGNYSYLSVIDQKNKEIWESIGFEVSLLEDFHPFASSLGAAHCISKYLERT